MEGGYWRIHYWLVEQPAIAEFEWAEHRTWGSSPGFLAASTLSYLVAVAFLSRFPILRLPTPLLRPLSALHNLLLVLLSLSMAFGTSLSALSHPLSSPRWLLCFPPSSTPPRGSLFFWAYLYYLSKFLEFFDTLLILLNHPTTTTRRSRSRLSFLHVYHHSLVPLMSYLWLRSSQSLFPIALVTNAAVHIVMYSYYLLSSLGLRPPWKRLVTDFQILQFLFSFAVSLPFLFLHFIRGGCSGFSAWLFNAAFNASLLALFLNFHSTNYKSPNNNNNNKPHHN